MEEQPENNGHYIRTSWRRPNPTVVNPPGGTSTPLSANINLNWGDADARSVRLLLLNQTRALSLCTCARATQPLLVLCNSEFAQSIAAAAD